MKKLGIMTNGGDCAGLNAALRAISLYATNHYGYRVYGINYGMCGLLGYEIIAKEIDPAVMDHQILAGGGTTLGTANSESINQARKDQGLSTNKEEINSQVMANIKKMKLDSLIIIGGDGTFRNVVNSKALKDLNFIGIPKTIDNDISGTERAIGFATAVEVAVEAMDRLQTTGASHNRVMILEVMGRDAGHIAIETAIAGGADIALIPELPYNIDKVINKVKAIKAQGRRGIAIVVSESVKPPVNHGIMQGGALETMSQYLARAISQETNLSCRVTVLGHLQRGAKPIAQDRCLAAAMGVKAVDLIHSGETRRMVTVNAGDIGHICIKEAVAKYNSVSLESNSVKTAKALGICLG